MQRLSLPFESVAELCAEAQVDEQRVRLRLAGTADLRVADEIDRVLRVVHARAVASEVCEVVVDLRDLEFMNSSCFKGFASWIAALQGAESERTYSVRFLSNRAILWQRRSLHALSCLAPTLVSVDSISSSRLQGFIDA